MGRRTRKLGSVELTVRQWAVVGSAVVVGVAVLGYFAVTLIVAHIEAREFLAEEPLLREIVDNSQGEPLRRVSQLVVDPAFPDRREAVLLLGQYLGERKARRERRIDPAVERECLAALEAVCDDAPLRLRVISWWVLAHYSAVHGVDRVPAHFPSLLADGLASRSVRVRRDTVAAAAATGPRIRPWLSRLVIAMDSERDISVLRSLIFLTSVVRPSQPAVAPALVRLTRHREGDVRTCAFDGLRRLDGLDPAEFRPLLARAVTPIPWDERELDSGIWHEAARFAAAAHVSNPNDADSLLGVLLGREFHERSSKWVRAVERAALAAPMAMRRADAERCISESAMGGIKERAAAAAVAAARLAADRADPETLAQSLQLAREWVEEFAAELREDPTTLPWPDVNEPWEPGFQYAIEGLITLAAGPVPQVDLDAVRLVLRRCERHTSPWIQAWAARQASRLP